MRTSIVSAFWLAVTCVSVIASEIHELAKAGEIEKLKKVVGSNSSAVNERDKLQHTPLHFAALMGRTEMVDLLLKSGADARAANFQRNTPGHFAAARGHIEIAKKLLASKPEILNAKGAGGILPRRSRGDAATIVCSK